MQKSATTTTAPLVVFTLLLSTQVFVALLQHLAKLLLASSWSACLVN